MHAENSKMQFLARFTKYARAKIGHITSTSRVAGSINFAPTSVGAQTVITHTSPSDGHARETRRIDCSSLCVLVFHTRYALPRGNRTVCVLVKYWHPPPAVKDGYITHWSRSHSGCSICFLRSRCRPRNLFMLQPAGA